MTDKAKKKFEILVFWEKHGLEATMDAFKVKRRTLFLWKKQLREGNTQSHLIPPLIMPNSSQLPPTLRERISVSIQNAQTISEEERAELLESVQTLDEFPEQLRTKLAALFEAEAAQREQMLLQNENDGAVIAQALDEASSFTPEEMQEREDIVTESQSEVEAIASQLHQTVNRLGEEVQEGEDAGEIEKLKGFLQKKPEQNQ